MKITKLCGYFKDKSYFHNKWDTVPIDYKCKIYEARKDKSISMSKNKFAKYLKKFWLWRTNIFGIIKEWSLLEDWLCFRQWEKRIRTSYKKRYTYTVRSKKIKKEFTKVQKEFISKLRLDYPNMWYKRFDVWLRNPENKDKYDIIFKDKKQISKRQYYEILKDMWYEKEKTKRQKKSLIKDLRAKQQLEWYVAKMKHIYMWYKALHRRQVDIKYLNDIPNYLNLWLLNIYLYEITFRDFKTWTTICFYWNNRDRTRVSYATKVFKFILIQIWIDPKNVTLQFDWWAEFWSTKITWSLWKYLEYVDREFKWHKIIDKKEQNWQVEAFHLMIEKDCFDSNEIYQLKNQKWEIWKNKSKIIKEKTLKIADEYIKNTNQYWYSSYIPKIQTFWKKSPLQITKDDRWDKLNYFVYKKFLWAYDIDNVFKFKRAREYPLFINSVINYYLGGHIWAVRYIKYVKRLDFPNFLYILIIQMSLNCGSSSAILRREKDIKI
jgi:hypothetical protein